MQEGFTGARDEKLRSENAYIRGPLRIVMCFLHAEGKLRLKCATLSTCCLKTNDVHMLKLHTHRSGLGVSWLNDFTMHICAL